MPLHGRNHCRDFAHFAQRDNISELWLHVSQRLCRINWKIACFVNNIFKWFESIFIIRIFSEGTGDLFVDVWHRSEEQVVTFFSRLLWFRITSISNYSTTCHKITLKTVEMTKRSAINVRSNMISENLRMFLQRGASIVRIKSLFHKSSDRAAWWAFYL